MKFKENILFKISKLLGREKSPAILKFNYSDTKYLLKYSILGNLSHEMTTNICV